MTSGVIFGIQNLTNLFVFLIILRIFLTWIPNLDWYAQPWRAIREVVDSYLDIFRKIIPPFGGLDFSPIIAVLVLQLVANILTAVLSRTF